MTAVLSVILLLALVVVGGFLGIQHKRRAGGVLASRRVRRREVP